MIGAGAGGRREPLVPRRRRRERTFAWAPRTSTACFSRPSSAVRLDALELSVAFTLSIAFIAVGVLVGGRWQDRRGPAAVSLAGALLFSAGIFLSRYTDSLAWLYGCYGVVVGLGSGIGYTCPLSVGMKWFPERRGLVTE